MGTTCEVVKVTEVDAHELWGVYRRHFDADPECLAHTLARATHVACFRDQATRELRGMVTFTLRPADGGYRKLYVNHVLQADEGCDLDFLVGCRGNAVPRHSH